MIVIFLSRSLSIVRLAIIPGIPQPVPTSIGINDLPESPKRRKTRSIIKAIRAIYPQASRNARSRNKTSICGTNPSTAPTPATIPSRIKPLSQSAHSIASKTDSIRTGIPGTHIPKSSEAGPSSPYFSTIAFAVATSSSVKSIGSETSRVSSS